MSSPSSPRWIRLDVALAIHEAQVGEHGGITGVRDVGLLESALARPPTAFSYAEADICALAAIYALAIVRNPPFFDGNKRVGFTLLELFLDLNGYAFEADDADVVTAILDLAAGTTSDEEFTGWVRRWARPVGLAKT